MANRLREFRLARGLTLEQVAEAADTSHQQVLRLEKGERRLTVDWMVRLARPLGVEPKDLLPDSGMDGALPTKLPDPARGRMRDVVPVLGAARGGTDQEMFLKDGPIDHVARPASLAGIRGAYVLTVVGDSMVPRYRAGFLLHVNPFKTPLAGNGVVVRKRDDSVLVKEFVSLDRDFLVLRQFNPALSLTIPRAEVRECHTVVGTQEV